MKTTITISFFLILSSSLLHPTHGAFSEEISEAITMIRIPKTTHFHFFFHDIHTGDHPSAVRVAAAAGSSDLDDGTFGDTYVVDNALREGQDALSTEVGRAQGLYTFSDWKEASLLMMINFVFSRGEFNGSGVSMLGRNPLLHDVRELPIIAGTGRLRYASGYALGHEVWSDPVTGDAVVEYHLYVNHY